MATLYIHSYMDSGALAIPGGSYWYIEPLLGKNEKDIHLKREHTCFE
jgi:hypothetical protein